MEKSHQGCEVSLWKIFPALRVNNVERETKEIDIFYFPIWYIAFNLTHTSHCILYTIHIAVYKPTASVFNKEVIKSISIKLTSVQWNASWILTLSPELILNLSTLGVAALPSLFFKTISHQLELEQLFKMELGWTPPAICIRNMKQEKVRNIKQEKVRNMKL